MLSVKLLGMLLLALGGVLAAIWLVRFERMKCRQAEGFLNLLRNIRLQIDCFGTPVGQILSSIDATLGKDIGITQKAQSFSELLKNTPLLLPKDFCRLLEEFALSLGTGYREEELRYCDYYIARLDPMCARMCEELEKRTRLALILPLALTGALILMLW